MKKKNRKPHALAKDILREIWKTKSRFIAIFAIIALGVGFFAGLKSASPDMLATAQQYFDDQNLCDLHLVSTYGFNEDDIAAVENYSDTETVQPGYSVDAFVSIDDNQDVIVTAYSLDLDTASSGDDYLNQLVVTEGRLPENENECVVDNSEFYEGMFELGDEITLFRNDDTLDDALSVETFTVVGFVDTPLYISYERGTTSLGNGQVNNYIYISEDAFSYDVYTDLWISLKSTEGVAFYEDAYDDAVQNALDDLQVIADSREETRYEEVYSDAKDELDDALAEWQDGYDDYEDGLAEVADGWDAYNEGLDTLKANEDKLDTQEQQLEDARDDLNDLTDLRDAVGDSITAFETTSIPLPASLPDDVATLVASSAAFNDILGSGVQFETVFEAYIRTDPADPTKAVLEAQLESMLNGVDTYISAAGAELDDGEIAVADGRKQISDGYAELADTKQQLLDAEADLKDAKAELDDSKAEIDDGYAELNDIEMPEWYLFDRDDFPGYSGYQDNADRIDHISMVFPVFFVLVALLVCLTTMTRMVEEQRTEIGTLKALGYNRSQIIMKYLIYASTASLAGCAFGLTVGFRVFPTVVFNAYRIMYILPDVIAPFRWNYALMTTAVALACTDIAAFAAAVTSLHEVPAELMRPKSPKAGRRIFLEKIGFFWNRLGFLKKVTVRNLFRYKRRILMTVIGIAGCTALLLAGFGIKASVGSIVTKQYNELFTYDATMIYDDTITGSDYDAMIAAIDAETEITEKMQIRISLMDASTDVATKQCYLLVTNSPDSIGDYITLRERVSQEPLTLGDDGVIITEKLSKMLEVSVGDTISVEVNDNEWVDCTVAGITENYATNYVYFSSDYYTSVVGTEPTYNGFMVNLTNTDNATEDELSSMVADNDNILTVTFTSQLLDDFSDTMDSLNYVVLVIIVCAGALAFIVLYNLANINVTERVREIATIKVLGFYDREVSKYINRENTISSILGIIVGLFLGIPLDRFILKTAEIDNLMFVPGLPPSCFIYAVVLTLGFTFIVNFVLHHTLRNVDMIESLKSIE